MEIKEMVAPIAARGLTKRYGAETVVEDLSFSTRWGAVTGFVGPNGAGKSTTMRMIAGLVRPTGGEALVMGRPYAALDDPSRFVGASLEAGAFHPRRTGRNHLRVLAAAAGLTDRRVGEVLDLVELGPAAKKNVGAYSLGMRQRLGLAAALIGDPSILMLDEPANGLDPAGIRWLRSFLRGYVEAGNAALVSSHLLGEVAQIADDVVVIRGGRLVRHATVAELTAGGSLEDVYFELTEQEAAR
ncbi:MAG TPA: ATP-binding cassette domain-containing protein [Actinomycetota bacterium]|nr:ATP-binding cassette domain-containing protein [Actinomycetota bacterium]